MAQRRPSARGAETKGAPLIPVERPPAASRARLVGPSRRGADLALPWPYLCGPQPETRPTRRRDPRPSLSGYWNSGPGPRAGAPSPLSVTGRGDVTEEVKPCGHPKVHWTGEVTVSERPWAHPSRPPPGLHRVGLRKWGTTGTLKAPSSSTSTSHQTRSRPPLRV